MAQTVAVSLGSDIEYVYGTVNGEPAEWQLVGSVWRTLVPRAQDGLYSIEITAYDAAGNSSDYRITLRYGLFLITDRTQTDVSDVKAQNARIAANLEYERPAFYGFTEAERAKWRSGLKGAYNASDLNRVEDAVRFLNDLLLEYGYVAAVRFRGEDWAVTDAAPAAELERYLGNVRALAETFAVLQGTPPLPGSMRKLTHEGANAIEQNLHDIYFLIQNMRTAYRYSGEDYAGE